LATADHDHPERAQATKEPARPATAGISEDAVDDALLSRASQTCQPTLTQSARSSLVMGSRPFLAALGAALGWFVGGVLRVRRAHVLAAMARAPIPGADRTSQAMYASLGRGLLELLAGALGGWRKLRRSVDLESNGALSTIEALLASGRGAVIATAHTGNWDLVACSAAERVPLTVVTKHLTMRLLDGLWQGFRARRGVRLVDAGRAAREAGKALGRGELVAMLIDQAPERARGVLSVPFLGAMADVDLAPALLALRARVPFVVAFPMRQSDGSHCLEVARILSPPRRASRSWAEDAMALATADLDGFVRRHPEQWLWMHRRWKRPSLGTLRRGDRDS
jgi:KDO2-lipid IV(A) lauroyltransferase